MSAKVLEKEQHNTLGEILEKEDKIMSIAKVIKTARKSRNLKQDQFGKLINVSQVTVSAWEKGTRKPDRTAILKLNKEFGIPLSKLIK